MNTMICAGGTGLRTLEAALHLCAMGLGPDLLRVLAVDPDGSNGNGARARNLINSYLQMREFVKGNFSPDSPFRMFRTELDLFDVEGMEQGLKVWTPVQPTHKLKDLLNFDNLPSTKTSQDIVRLFFTEDELDMELGQGFRGHTSIGAAAMSLISLHEKRPPWEQVIEKLGGDMGVPLGARIFIVASVFGGTGASAIHPLVRFLREVPPAKENPNRLKIGVGAIVPYFRFEASSAAPEIQRIEMAARAERFPLAAYSAAQYYQHLRINSDWPFDAVYWLGDNSPMQVPYAPGGPDQQNPAHFVDLLSALMCFDFFAQPEERGACYYSGPRQDVEGPGYQTLLDWEDLPIPGAKMKTVRRSMLRMFLCGVSHLAFFDPLLRRDMLDREPHRVPWYYERFATKRDWLTSQLNQDAIEKLTEYYKVHFFPWWQQVLSRDTVRLFNRQVITVDESRHAKVDLGRLANVEWPENPDRVSLDAMDRFFTDMVLVPKKKVRGKGLAAYLMLLDLAAGRFAEREYMRELLSEDSNG